MLHCGSIFDLNHIRLICLNVERLASYISEVIGKSCEKSLFARVVDQWTDG